jgi:ELWxxDGT repeat protein
MNAFWRFVDRQGPRSRRRLGREHDRRLRIEPLEDRRLLTVSVGDLPANDTVYVLPQYRLSNPGGYLSPPSPDEPLDIALDFVRGHAESFGLESGDLESLKVTDCYTDDGTGVTHIYLRQMWNGLEIVNANLSVNVATDGQVLNVGGGLLPGLTTLEGNGALDRFQNPPINAVEALEAAASELRLAEQVTATALAGPATADHPEQRMFQAPSVSLDVIPANEHYVAAADGLHLAWDFVFRTPDGEHWYEASVDARTGQALRASDWTDRATYTVYARPTETPDDGTRSVLTNPSDMSLSPYGWHDTDGQAGAEYTDTRGNNVFAQEDTDNNNSGGFRPDGGTTLDFNYTLDLGQAPGTYQSAAITNLFYWNNVCHDVHGRYGFTEQAGNFQQTNYTGAGKGSDAVQADAQDGGGMNNANFSTPPDGQTPRMQMYVFNATTPYRDGDLESMIIVHEYGHGVSNRVVGGPSNADALDAWQSGGMGEGWSDWWGLMLTQKATDAKTDSYPVGSYVTNDSGGIRRYPYSFQMSVNPLTYGAYNSSHEVHNAGEIWCSVLWDLNWLLIDKYGFSADITQGYSGSGSAGNVLALQLVMDSLKLMPVNPSFLDGRDALLQADQLLTGGANAKAIWTAFARRGMGFSAGDGGSGNATTVTEAFDLPLPAISGHLPNGVSLAPISSVNVHFNGDMNTSSFSLAEDLISFTGPGGVDLRSTVTGYTWVDSSTLRIQFTTTSLDGQYTMVLGPQIWGNGGTALDQDGDGTAGESVEDRYTLAFRYDVAQLGVVAASPAAGSVVALPMTGLTLTFNEPYAPDTVGLDDLQLSQGAVAGFTLVDAHTIQYTLSGVQSEPSLHVSLAGGALTDLAGNPCAAYTGSYVLDVASSTLETPLKRLEPSGSLIGETSTANYITFAGDSDRFTLQVNAGESISVLGVPSAGLQPVIELRDPSGVLLRTASGAAAGADVTLETAVAPATGEYSVTVRDSGSATGNYMLKVYVSATLEAESHGGTANDTPATGQEVNGAFTSLGSTAQHTAVLGRVETGDSDCYRFTLDAGQTASLELAADDPAAAVLELYDSQGTRLTLGAAAVGSVQVIENFVADASATFVARVFGNNTDYRLLIARGAAIDREKNDDMATAQPMYSSPTALGYLRNPPPSTSDFGAAAAITTSSAAQAEVGSDGDAEYVAGELIVRFAEGTSSAAQAGLVAALGGAIVTDLPLIHGAVVRLADGYASIADAVDAWESDPNVVYAEPNYILTATSTIPNDADFSLLDGLHNTGQTGGTADCDIDAPEAWDTLTGSSVVIASIDTGVDYLHEDLAANMWTNPGEIADDGIDNDGNGFVDDVHGIDAYNNDADPIDDAGHGSHTSGTMAGVGNNGIGVAGVNWKAQIMALKFLGAGGSGPTAAAIVCIQYMTLMKTTYGVNVVVSNNSWGGSTYDQGLYDAIAASNAAGIVFVASAGNANHDNDSGSPAYPGSYDLPGIISVAATDHSDMRASFSSYGATTVDLAAPGVDTYSCIPGNGYGYKSGTSMAAPHVAGAVALLAAADPGATVAELKAAILSGTDPVPDMAGKCITGGRLNLAKSLSLIGDPGDYYQVEVSDDDTLVVRTHTPSSDAWGLGNTLDPKVELYDPAGACVASNDNGSADGRNAYLEYSAATAGTYVVRVFSVGQRGEYVLEVAGAGGSPAFSVQSTTPVANARVRYPTHWTVDFNDGVLLNSLAASDLTVDGVPATAVTLVDYDTATFTLPTGLADGVHTLALATGGVSDLQRTPLSAWTAQFTVDTTAPRVIGTSVQKGDTLATDGPTLSVQFNEALRSDCLDLGDFELLGITQNWKHAPTSYRLESDNTVLRLSYADLPDDNYVLTLKAGDNRFEDLVGVDLDGETPTWPIGPNRSGDGVEGGNLVVDFTIHCWGTDHAPVAVDDTYNATAYSPLAIAASGVLANDTDVDADPLRAALVSAPLHGTVTLDEDGSFTYSPEDGYFGADQFTYRASDGTAASFVPAVVRITVGSPRMLADIQPSINDGVTSSVFSVGGVGLFAATDALHGLELWRTDGTLNGTWLLKDIYVGPNGSNPTNMALCNGVLFFSAASSTNGIELWKSDGTEAGTVLVKDLNPWSNSSSPANLTNVGGMLFFSANDSGNGTELWKSNGTASGTVLVKDLVAGSGSSLPQSLVNVGGQLYFTATDATNGRELWASDGTAAGTAIVKDIYTGTSSSTPANLTAVGNRLFFVANDGTSGIELWTSNGTPDGTTLVKDILAGSSTSAPANLTAVGDTLFFAANNSTNGLELWKSNGFEAGTSLVRDIYPNAGSSNPTYLTNVNGTLFFSATDPTNGNELWQSGGAPANTTIVKNIAASGSSSPAWLTNVNGTLYFSANTTGIGVEPWISDGSAEGTVLLKNLTSDSLSSSPTNFSAAAGSVFFTATLPSTGRELWRTDGTAARTVLVKDIRRSTGDSNPAYLAEMNGAIYFNATNAATGAELWRSDGTFAGTTLVKDSTAGNGGSYPALLTNVNGTLFFSATSGTNGYELWASNGTADGTSMFKDLRAGANSSSPAYLVNAGGRLFFAANDGTSGSELWTSDGTVDGTVLVKDILTGANSSGISLMTAVGSRVFFAANDGTSGSELWTSDGTAGGTLLLRDIYPGSNGSSLSYLTAVGDTLYFRASDPTTGYELWKSNGTADGTVLVKDIYAGTGGSSPSSLTNFNGILYFSAGETNYGTELWRSNGTSTGTYLVRDIYSGTYGSSPSYLTNVGGVLFFAASNGANGTELWRSDGTSSGTAMLSDIWPGSGGSSIRAITNVGGVAYFVANDGSSGNELWRSNGTAAGTQLFDLALGGDMSDPQTLTAVGKSLFFTAVSATAGREVWVVREGPRVLSAVPADATPTAAAEVHYTVTFNRPVTGVDPSDFRVLGDGVADAQVTAVAGSGTLYTVTVATGTGSGTLRLMLADDDSIVDSESDPLGNPAHGNGDFTAREAYTLDRTPPVARLLDVLPNPRTMYVEQLDLVFGEAVTGLDLGDLELTRDGNGVNLLTTAQTLWTAGGGTWFLGNLAGVTAYPGVYTLRIVASGAGIADALGNVMAIDSSLSWTLATHTPPVAYDDVYSTACDTTLSVAASGVLANDTAAGGYTLSVQRVSGPQHGSLNLSTTGAFQYTPETGFAGTDVFTYTFSDGTMSSTATVAICVGWPQAVKEINAAAADSSITSPVEIGQLLFLLATDARHGQELWRTDGTPAGTFLLKDIYPGTSTSSPQSLVNVNGALYFSADNGSSGRELWRSDGTPDGTVMLKDITPGVYGSYPTSLVNCNGALFFQAANSTNGYELWTSNGTAEGTLLFKDIVSGSGSSYPAALANINGTLYFQANDGLTGNELWKSDGTPEGTVRLVDINPGTNGSSPTGFVGAGGLVYFVANDGTSGTELWRTDGTAAGTYLTTDIVSGLASPGVSQLTAVGNTVFFRAATSANGSELWKSNGTAAGTLLVREIYAGTGSSNPYYLTNLNGTLFFQATDGSTGYELWKSDGTADGTAVFKDIYAGSASSSPGYLTNLNGVLYFQAYSVGNGAELWKSDGTDAGTVQVKDLWSGASSSNPNTLVGAAGMLYFTAADGTHGRELWRSDGSASGTTMVCDIRTGSADAAPGYLTNLGGTLYFQANDGVNLTELWKSDGTTAGTALVKDTYPSGGSGSPANLTNVSGTLFFSVYTYSTGTELWKSNGTDAGTTMIKDIYPGTGNSSPAQLTNVNGTLFFQAVESATGSELWKSDGTSDGTSLVKEINPGPGGATINYLTASGGMAYFYAYNSAVGYELWRSNGTDAGTFTLDINPGAGGSYPAYLTDVGGTLFFSATNGSTGYELWRSNGTAAGTVLVKDIYSGGNSSSPQNLANVNGMLYFAANNGTNGYELWKSNGTAAGTVLVKDIWPGANGSGPMNLANVNGTLYFAANDGTHGVELWTSDGTAAGTVMVKDIAPGAASSMPQNMTAVGAAAYFRANDGTSGTELWRTDGTLSGTAKVADVALGAESSDPANLAEMGGNLYFSAVNGFGGRELYIIGEPPVASSIVPLDPQPTNVATVRYLVTFSKQVTGVDVADFNVTSSGPTATVASVAGSGASYVVTLNTGTGNGTIGLTLGDNDSIVDILANPLGGKGLLNGNLQSSQSYNIDKTSPTGGIVQVTPEPQTAGVAQIAIVFSEPVIGFDRADLILTRDGGGNLLGAAHTLTTSDGVTWVLGNLGVVTDWTGSYTLALAAGSGITDAARNPLASVANMSWAATVNHAPILNNTLPMTLSALEDDDPPGDGMLLSAILATAGDPITDPDGTTAEGVAVTAVVDTCGTWQYRLGTGEWTAFGSLAAAAARLLPADSATWIRFVPNPGWYGTLTDGLTFRAWDRSEGTAGETADTTTNSGHTAFSAATATASITVIHVNYLPVVAAVTGSPQPVELGFPLTLTATGVADPTPAGWVASVAFYRESNGVAGLQIGGDTLVGTDSDSSDGWSIDAYTSGLALGTHTYYAQATDNEGGLSPAGLEAPSTTSTVTLTYNLDADGNGTADALTDGILILRYLFSPSGAWNFSDAVGVGATRNTRESIRSFLDGAKLSVLDADGNGTADALTDGILILRYLFNPTGAWNFSDAVGVGARRSTREAIRSHLAQYLPGHLSNTFADGEDDAAAALRSPVDGPLALRTLDEIFKDW